MSKRGFASLVAPAASHVGLTLHRWPANRFDAMTDALLLLRDRGFNPRVVIDVGANVGTWTDLAKSVFPEARFHLVEPQTACSAALQRFSRSTSTFTSAYC